VNRIGLVIGLIYHNLSVHQTTDLNRIGYLYHILSLYHVHQTDPKGLKLPPLEQRQKRGYCKFHGNFVHNTSRCVVFRDSVQKTLDEGMLMFGDKPNQPMQVDTDPLKKVDYMYMEIAGMNMVEISEIDPIVANGPKVDVEMVTEGHKCAETMITEDQYEEKIQVVFPKAEEDLIDFLNICKISGFPSYVVSQM
jgi:hypothetical protein